LHQLTTDLVDHFDVIASEDLNGAGMLKNHSWPGLLRIKALANFAVSGHTKWFNGGRRWSSWSAGIPTANVCVVWNQSAKNANHGAGVDVPRRSHTP
jgi:hypothetical protein